MVPHLLRSAVGVAVFLLGTMLIYKFMTWEPSGAEGPYRKAQAGRCVCK